MVAVSTLGCATITIRPSDGATESRCRCDAPESTDRATVAAPVVSAGSPGDRP